jgi:hypothetical protein
MSNYRKDWTMPVITIVGIFVLTLLLNATIAPEPTYTFVASQKSQVSPLPYTGRQHVYAIDQEATNKISVLSFSLTSTGFLAVSDEKTGEVLGVTPLLSPGLYGAGIVPLAKSVVPGQTLVATVYTDNGNGKFDAPSKEKVKDASTKDTAESVTSSFVILGDKVAKEKTPDVQ